MNSKASIILTFWLAQLLLNICGRHVWTRGVLTVAEPEHHAALVRRAEVHRLRGELDHDEPPDGQGQGEPDGDGVDVVAEVHVEQHKVAPSLGQLEKLIHCKMRKLSIYFSPFIPAPRLICPLACTCEYQTGCIQAC